MKYNILYGFNGKETDGEWGAGNGTQDYGFRMYNPSISKFLSVDPLTKEYPWYTPYQFAGNMPIIAIDLDGLEEYIVVNWTNSGGELIGKAVIKVPKGPNTAQALYLNINAESVSLSDVRNRTQTLTRLYTNSWSRSSLTQFTNQLTRGDLKSTRIPGLSSASFQNLDNIETNVVNNETNLNNAYSKLRPSDSPDAPLWNTNVSMPATRSDGAQRGGLTLMTAMEALDAKFEVKSAKIAISPELESKIASLATFLLFYGTDYIVEITGHTDSDNVTYRSTNEEVPENERNGNLGLSWDRAIAIRDALVAKGVDPNSIKVSGKGATEPIEKNDTDAGKAKNRRIESKIALKKN